MLLAKAKSIPIQLTMKLTHEELRIHAWASGLSPDAKRQAAFHTLDEQIRARLPEIPERRYYTFNPVDGRVIVDMNRDRPLPVLKISKSDQL
jgi:hypothetical protein